MVTLACPTCQKELHIPDQYRGQTGRCKHCGAAVKVPEEPPHEHHLSREEAAHMSVDEILAEALREDLPVDEVAQDLLDHVKLDARGAEKVRMLKEKLINDGEKINAVTRKVEKLVDELRMKRARVMAETGLHRLREAAKLEQARDKGATHKIWKCATEDAGNETCRACEAEGPIPIDQPFATCGQLTPPSGDEPCQCTLSFVRDTGHGELDDARHRVEAHLESLGSAQAATNT